MGRGKPDSYVAELATKLGRWNREIAQGDAIADYYEAYHPSLLSLAPRPASSNPPTISLVARGGNRSNRRRNRRTDHGWPRPKVRPIDTRNSNSNQQQQHQQHHHENLVTVAPCCIG